MFFLIPPSSPKPPPCPLKTLYPNHTPSRSTSAIFIPAPHPSSWHIHPPNKSKTPSPASHTHFPSPSPCESSPTTPRLYNQSSQCFHTATSKTMYRSGNARCSYRVSSATLLYRGELFSVAPDFQIFKRIRKFHPSRQALSAIHMI